MTISEEIAVQMDNLMALQGRREEIVKEFRQIKPGEPAAQEVIDRYRDVLGECIKCKEELARLGRLKSQNS